MNWRKIWQLMQSDYVKLVPILALSFYMVLIPHLHDPYPVHIDEWRHIAHSNVLLDETGTNLVDPFSGQPTSSRVAVLERGFHLFWGVFHQISGISLLTIYRYFPSIIFMITTLSVYILARREGFGWQAALFTCLIPTTVGIMGPAFLIPVAMGLLFVPLSLFVVFNLRTGWAYTVLFMFTCFLGIVHPPSAICLIIILTPFVILNLKGNFVHSLAIALAVATPFLLTLPWTSDLILSTTKSLFVSQPLPRYHSLPEVIETVGYLVILSALLGTVVLAVRGSKRDYSLVLGLLALLLMLAVFYTAHYGVGIMYLRGLLFMMLMLSIVAGAGLMEMRRLKLPEKISLRLKVPLIVARNVGLVLCLLLIGLTLATVIPSHQDIPYYHMIDEADYEAFVWIEENIGDDYKKAILDPWKATAFTAITEKHVHTRTHMATSDKDREALTFLASGCKDTTFLKENGISIVYNRKPCSNPDLLEVRKNVYLLEEVGGQ